jgi:hypothetical protein
LLTSALVAIFMASSRIENRNRPFTAEEVETMEAFLRRNCPTGYRQIFGDEN